MFFRVTTRQAIGSTVACAVLSVVYFLIPSPPPNPGQKAWGALRDR